mgnify:CR=1 FL=1
MNDKWNDVYLDVPNDTINKLYSFKGCHYMQISDYGLYYLQDDICEFDVPKIDVEQEMRIRVKVHQRVTNKGFCALSVTASCKPKKIKNLIHSDYSLDDIKKLPSKLKYTK